MPMKTMAAQKPKFKKSLTAAPGCHCGGRGCGCPRCLTIGRKNFSGSVNTW